MPTLTTSTANAHARGHWWLAMSSRGCKRGWLAKTSMMHGNMYCRSQICTDDTVATVTARCRKRRHKSVPGGSSVPSLRGRSFYTVSKRGSLFSPHSQLPRASHVGHAESAGRFLANLAMGLVNCRATPAPLAVFCHMDHMDMSQLHSGGAEAEICAVVAGES